MQSRVAGGGGVRGVRFVMGTQPGLTFATPGKRCGLTLATAGWLCGLTLAALAALVEVATSCGLACAQAEPGAREVPAALAPWTNWVLAQHDARLCPVRFDLALCVWPGRLTLELDDRGGRFALEVQVDRRSVVPLPGGRGRWPVAVRADGKPAAVVAYDPVIVEEQLAQPSQVSAPDAVPDTPALVLEPGSHRIEGRFGWQRLPESLPVPELYGLLSLEVRGQRVARPKRDAAGLWLQGQSEPEEQAQLDLIVQRKIQDGIPLLVETRIRIRAAGQAREVDLGPVLLEGSVPMWVRSDLPVRLDVNGALRLQARAGSFLVTILSRLTKPATRLVHAARPAPWPSEEAWVFQADEALRQVQLSGARSVDALRLDLDPDWRGLPAFLLASGEALEIATTRRGDPDPIPNQLNLKRTLWLDQDGRGYTVHDQLQGELHSGFRLELRGFDLGRVASRGQDLLITRTSDKAAAGVELRDSALDVSADWRADSALGELPAVAWSEDVRSLGVSLRMPPGYALFSVSGVDRVDRSWLQDWDLLGFFFVLLLALGTGRVAGIAFGVVGFLALGISYHEPDAPVGVWIALLVLVALLRVIPEGRTRSAARGFFWAAWLVFAVQILPFATRSLREAIYPQLGDHDVSSAPALGTVAPEPPQEAISADAQEAKGGAVPAAAPISPAALGERSPGEAGIAARIAARKDLRQNYAIASSSAAKTAPDPDAIVQTGPGLPDWAWRNWELSWSGPVQRDHRFELWIMPPRLTRSLAVLRVLLCALLAYGLLRAGGGRAPRSRRPPPAAAGAAGLILLLWAAPSRAQFPDKPLLEELRARLSRPPACRPNCVAVAELELRVGAQGLALSGEVHAQDRSSVRLPGPSAVWVPDSVRIDGAEAQLLVLRDGFLHVRVTPGVHKLEASGPLPPQDALTLRLGDAPAQVRVHSEGYEVLGVREDGTADDSLELKRTFRQPGDVQKPDERVSLPPWFSVTRELDLALSYRVHTTLQRETPIGSAIVAHLPLLPGESVNDARLQVKDGEIFATLGPDEQELRFDSTLAAKPELTLVASESGAYAERWRVRCGSLYRCATEPLVPVARVENGSAVASFRPWPGEKLRVQIARPKPAAGQSTTVDSARFQLQPGVRQTDATLLLDIRTSRGGAHSVQLPEGARVRTLSVDGAPRPVHSSDRKLSFSLLPGAAKIAIALELPVGASPLFEVPKVRIDTPVVNARVLVKLPPDRWLLWLRGPNWGPAILFWGYLAFALLLGALLARTGLTPLRLVEWLLLAIGLTQVDAIEALAVIAFFFLFGYRERTRDLPPLRHNFFQLGLALATFVAAGSLFDAVQHGLLMQPSMQVAGAGWNGDQLEWYVDRTGGALPTPSLLSVPIWVYRALMLLWSLWLASRLLRWLPWAFRAFIAGGAWKRGPKRPAPPPWSPPGPPAPPAPPPAAAPSA